MVKEFLSQKGVGFKDIDVSRDRAAAQEMIQRSGQMGVPVVIIDDQTIVGFDRSQIEQALSRMSPEQRPSFGASVADATKVTGGQGAKTTPGAYVGNVRPGSVADKMGLAAGDIITEINMQRIASASELEATLSKFSKGSRLSVVFLRGDKTLRAEETF